MNNIAKYVLISIIFSFSTLAIAETLKVNNKQKNDAIKITAIQSELIVLKDELKENQKDLDKVRNEQINYKIEKDLLKETYSSSFNTVNTVVSVIFAAVTLLGYLVFRNIKEIQSEYKNELESVRVVKNSFDAELDNLKSKQAEFESAFVSISKTNEDQNQRLKTLELIEKISNLVQGKHYEWAQRHIAIGLDSDPNNFYLLGYKAQCHGKMGEFHAFIDSSKKILDLESNDSSKLSTALNLLEGYAITNQMDEFNSLYSLYKDSVIKNENGAVNAYLKALMSISSGNIIDAIRELKSYVEQNFDTQPRKHLGLWTFDEVSIYLNNLADEKSKHLMLTSIRFFNGEMSKEEFISQLEQLSHQA